MSWREVWREHCKKTGDFWVDRALDRYQVIDENEREQILRKKALMRKRSAQIVKATVNGRVVGHQRVENEDHIHYRERLALLIKHNDYFYLEEHAVEKKGIFQGDQLIKDRTINREETGERPEQVSKVNAPRSTKRNRSPLNYDRSAVVKYAEKWWDSHNSDYPSFDVDCTNYVSQCLRAGGVPMVDIGEKAKGWWCQGSNHSFSWSVANSLRWYLASEGNVMNAIEVESPDQLVPGDVICYDWEGDGKWNHNVIVTEKDWDGMPLVNAHTYNSRNRYWSYEDSPAYTDNTQYLFFHIGAEK